MSKGVSYGTQSLSIFTQGVETLLRITAPGKKHSASDLEKCMGADDYAALSMTKDCGSELREQ